MTTNVRTFLVEQPLFCFASLNSTTGKDTTKNWDRLVRLRRHRGDLPYRSCSLYCIYALQKKDWQKQNRMDKRTVWYRLEWEGIESQFLREVVSTGCGYANDVTILATRKYTHALVRMMRSALGKVISCCDRTGLSVNPDRTVIGPSPIKEIWSKVF